MSRLAARRVVGKDGLSLVAIGVAVAVGLGIGLVWLFFYGVLLPLRSMMADARHFSGEKGKGDRHLLCDDQRFASVPASGPFRQKVPVPFSLFT